MTTITLNDSGAQIVGVPAVTEWADALTQALNAGASATWQRVDLIGFAEEEAPYEDDHYQYVASARISLGTYRNDARRYRRFPRGHALRRLMHDLSPSHYDAVAPLSDDDAETVLLECVEIEGVQEGQGREYARQRAKEIMQIPDPQRASVTLLIDASGNVSAAVTPPTWAWNSQFEVTLREKVA